MQHYLNENLLLGFRVSITAVLSIFLSTTLCVRPGLTVQERTREDPDYITLYYRVVVIISRVGKTVLIIYTHTNIYNDMR